ncbi:MAG: hypothetical protein R3F31_04220 [Verrucomicrobiales bacterium]
MVRSRVKTGRMMLWWYADRRGGAVPGVMAADTRSDGSRRTLAAIRQA